VNIGGDRKRVYGHPHLEVPSIIISYYTKKSTSKAYKYDRYTEMYDV